ncbi:hypothetical protein A2U01_0046493, partial [Trifolium medium]|nr:hypothetical protein [Trifolium medium]
MIDSGELIEGLDYLTSKTMPKTMAAK